MVIVFKFLSRHVFLHFSKAASKPPQAAIGCTWHRGRHISQLLPCASPRDSSSPRTSDHVQPRRWLGVRPWQFLHESFEAWLVLELDECLSNFGWALRPPRHGLHPSKMFKTLSSPEVFSARKGFQDQKSCALTHDSCLHCFQQGCTSVASATPATDHFTKDTIQPSPHQATPSPASCQKIVLRRVHPWFRHQIHPSVHCLCACSCHFGSKVWSLCCRVKHESFPASKCSFHVFLPP